MIFNRTHAAPLSVVTAVTMTGAPCPTTPLNN